MVLDLVKDCCEENGVELGTVSLVICANYNVPGGRGCPFCGKGVRLELLTGVE